MTDAPRMTPQDRQVCERCGEYEDDCAEIDHCDHCGNVMDGDRSATADVCFDCWRTRAAEVEQLTLALRNTLALALRIRTRGDLETAEHLIRFCAAAGVEPNVLRGES